jgi:prostaglandin-E synthase
MTAQTAVAIPPVLWAQRKDKIYLAIDLPEVKNEKVELDEKKLVFSCTAGTPPKQYRVEIEFYKEVKPSESKWAVHGKQTEFIIVKKEAEKKYWPRLLKAEGKPRWLAADWSKWTDEDEENEKPNFDFGSFSGTSGLDAGDDDDSDDDMPMEDDEDDKKEKKNESKEEKNETEQKKNEKTEDKKEEKKDTKDEKMETV